MRSLRGIRPGAAGERSQQPSPEMQELDQGCLQLLTDLYEVSEALGTRTCVWGGMVIDILSGEFLRAHHDVDGFTLNLLKVKTEMASMLTQKGYTASYLDDYDILQIKKGEIRAGFNRLEVDRGIAKWRHVGDQGTICFPSDWLDAAPRKFLGAHVYTSGPLFEYAIKTNVQLMSPEWQLREKDRDAIRFLHEWLEKEGVDIAAAMSRIWSYTPFWVSRGYPEYARPVRARDPD